MFLLSLFGKTKFIKSFPNVEKFKKKLIVVTGGGDLRMKI